MAGQVTRSERATTATANDLETTLFLQALEGQLGVDFLSFNPTDMQRKLARYVTSTGVASVSALQGSILRDETLGAEVIRMLNRSSAHVHNYAIVWRRSNDFGTPDGCKRKPSILNWTTRRRPSAIVRRVGTALRPG